MSSIYEAKEEMHQIEAQLYPNHLAGGENTYLAKNVICYLTFVPLRAL